MREREANCRRLGHSSKEIGRLLMERIIPIGISSSCTEQLYFTRARGHTCSRRENALAQRPVGCSDGSLAYGAGRGRRSEKSGRGRRGEKWWRKREGAYTVYILVACRLILCTF